MLLFYLRAHAAEKVTTSQFKQQTFPTSASCLAAPYLSLFTPPADCDPHYGLHVVLQEEQIFKRAVFLRVNFA